jgi:hypothetical protein
LIGGCNILTMEKIKKIWLTKNSVYIETVTGKIAHENFSDYPRLQYATLEQRKDYTISSLGIHWGKLDEDLSFECFFKKKNSTTLFNFFMKHPELNVSAIARMMNMKQSLLAAYITGAKNPSEKRKKEILKTINSIGQKLSSVKSLT